MKPNVYVKSLVYSILINLSFLVLLKVVFPELEIFTDPRILIVESISIFGFYFVIILFFKRELKRVAKKAFRKSSKRQKEKAMEATRDKDFQLALLKDREKYRREFLGNVSHELKTPLFTIQSYILTLIDGAISDKKIRINYLNRINKSVDRLIYIVRDLDVLAAIESGNYQLDIKPLDFEQLVNDVFDFLEIKAKESQVKIYLDSTLKRNEKVLGDQERLEQVMTNLLSNAIMHNSGEKAEVKVRLRPLENTIKVEVIDNGTGISEEHRQRIFERFYRTDSARSRNTGGSGLGLAIVKNILDEHGTEIKIESEVGKGSTFSFELERA